MASWPLFVPTAYIISMPHRWHDAECCAYKCRAQLDLFVRVFFGAEGSRQIAPQPAADFGEGGQ